MSRLRLVISIFALFVALPLLATHDVLISEYVEGTSNNKAIELYNPTASAINLSTGQYRLEYYFNGSGTVGTTITLTGSIPAGGVYVIAQSSASFAADPFVNQTNGASWYNGDDAIILRKGGAGGPIVDSIGQVGNDPGTEWGTGVQSTADNTLRRNATVCEGDINSTDAFNPATEWAGFATDTFNGLGAHTASCGGITLNISDVTLAEGDPPGTTTFTFAVTLTAPAGPGGVTFDIGTADNTATTADNDYVTNSLTGQTIAMGSTGPYNFNVTVNRDVTTEANETFFVNVTNITGATAGDTQGTGTISNDDVSITPIHDIQGPGASSPIVGASVTTRGIVTGVRSNGFFIQEPDASVDADPATSEGILVFTSSAPPAGAVVGAHVQVTGTVTEFVPSADPLQPPLTELTAPTVVQLSTGNPLPAAIPLTPTFPDPAGVHDQLERLEGMRVSAASLTVVGPTLGSLSEANATSTSTGVFYGVITGVPRPFREPGIQAPDPAPSGGGTIPPIPRFDSNPERIRVDSDGLVGGPLIDVNAGAAVTGLIGQLDYSFRTYTILPDPGATIGVSGGATATSVTAPTGQEFTVASYNVQRFFDTADDAGKSDVVLTVAAFDKRLAKASLGIRNNLRMPDIVAFSEMENLTTLQALAARISADAIAASQPDPLYDAYLVEGNDVGGIDVAFLVKTATVAPATPRVEVVAVQQELAGTMFVNPDSSSELLNDRPPLRLNAIIHHPNGASFPITVIANHLRSLGSANSEAAGSNGWSTLGTRVRAKRQQQAEDLANLVQARQTGDPTEHILLVGDFNAFEVNDGLGHSMGIIAGVPVPDNETAVAGDGVDLVNPDFDNLFDSPPAPERYGYVFDGNVQNLDHALVNAPLDTDTSAHRMEHARINADFADTARNDGTTPVRLSDHDPLLVYFAVPAFATADLAITKTDSPDPVNAGANLTYSITVTNNGPDPASSASWSDTLPAGTTFVSLSAPGGWSCTTPAVGANGPVSCSIASLGVGSANFTLIVAVIPSVAAGTVLSNTATVTSSTADNNTANDSATATTTVATSADLSITKTDSPDPANAGTNLVYTITVTNAGPSNAASVSLSDPIPAGAFFQSLNAPAGWSCITPAVLVNGTVTCTISSLAPGSAVFTLTVFIDSGLAGGTVLSNTATVSSTTSDPSAGNESATTTTTVTTAADLTVTKVDTPDPVVAGTNLTYTITVFNNGPSVAQNTTMTDTLPAGTTFVSMSAPAWSCTTPAVGATGTVTCTRNFSPASQALTLVVAVDPALTSGTVISNTATVSSTTSDPNSGNESATATTTVGVGSADLSITKTDNPDPVNAGANLTYTITVNNAGPTNASDVSMSDTLPANTTFVSLASPAGWSCITPAVGATGTVTCTNANIGAGNAVFTLVVSVGATTPSGTTITNTATVSSSTADPSTGNESATSATLVQSPANLSAVKSVSGTFSAGSTVTYTIVLTNNGPSTQQDNPGDELVDVLSSSLTLVSATATTGTAVATLATNTVTWNGSLLAGASVTITIQATIGSVPTGTVISNQAATHYDADGNGTNEAAGQSDSAAQPGSTDPTTFTVGAPAHFAAVPTLDEWALLALGALLAAVAMLAMKR